MWVNRLTQNRAEAAGEEHIAGSFGMIDQTGTYGACLVYHADLSGEEVYAVA
jgi:hypothetical protein